MKLPPILLAQESTKLDLVQVFQGSPTIYTVLFILSIFSISLFIYCILTLQKNTLLPPDFFQAIKEKLQDKSYQASMSFCEEKENLGSRLLLCALNNKKYGRKQMLVAVQEEGTRFSSRIFERLSLLSDVAVIAPMLGLLGTVIGMFYGFYGGSKI